MFDEEEDLDRILEGAEFDVEEMMDSASMIEDDGWQERTGVVKAPTLNVLGICSTGGLATREGSVGELRGGDPSLPGTSSISFYKYCKRGTARKRPLPGASSSSFYYDD